MTIPDLESFLGKDIKDICGNKFHDPNANHCAHFVSHAMEFGFSYDCKQFAGGNKPTANIRVHEVFAHCPRVGRWDDAKKDMSQLVFVTRKDVVDLPSRTMQNIPQKHIGIYHNGFVYNYSNTDDQVVKVPPADFLKRFEKIYDGEQALFFGEFPDSDLQLSVDPSGASVGDDYAFELRKDGSKWYARRKVAGETEFLAGVEVNQPAKKYIGLYFPGSLYYGPSYDAKKYLPVIDQWAVLLDMTAKCESSNRFNLINTYDRARFTFGFYQLAAHTPGDNLILFFRGALADPEFRKLFRDLELRGGKVFRVARDGTATDLEAETYDPVTKENQLQRFMAYLNPQRLVIDEQEVLQSARLVWWSNQRAACADAQVKVASAILQRKMSSRYAQWYNLDGVSDTICAVIADIHHQGRAGKSAVREALASSNKVAALLNLGKDAYPERIATLKERVKFWTELGRLGAKKYRQGTNEFA